MNNGFLRVFGVALVLVILLPVILPSAEAASCNYSGSPAPQVWTDKSRYRYRDGYINVYGQQFSAGCRYRLILSMNPANWVFGAYVKAGEKAAYGRSDGSIGVLFAIQPWWIGTMRLQVAPPDGSRVLAEYYFFLGF